jgi:hypothetical protein
MEATTVMRHDHGNGQRFAQPVEVTVRFGDLAQRRTPGVTPA